MTASRMLLKPTLAADYDCPLYISPTFEDIKPHIIIILTMTSELRSCVRVEADVLGFPSLIVRAVSVDVKQHLKKN